jgi:hypothetical protein
VAPPGAGYSEITMANRLHLARRVTEQAATVLIATLLLPAAVVAHQAGAGANENVPDITGEYHFLSPDDTLAILEEEGQLKGYIDVMQPSTESDDVLSFPIELGTRQGNQVTFKTRKIHERYYRFTGTAERGRGSKPDDADFIRLVGTLEIISTDQGQEHVAQQSEVFKSKSKAEREEDP